MFPDIGGRGRETRAHNISFLYESVLVAFSVENPRMDQMSSDLRDRETETDRDRETERIITFSDIKTTEVENIIGWVP